MPRRRKKKNKNPQAKLKHTYKLEINGIALPTQGNSAIYKLFFDANGKPYQYFYINVDGEHTGSHTQEDKFINLALRKLFELPQQAAMIRKLIIGKPTPELLNHFFELMRSISGILIDDLEPLLFADLTKPEDKHAHTIFPIFYTQAWEHGQPIRRNLSSNVTHNITPRYIPNKALNSLFTHILIRSYHLINSHKLQTEITQIFQKIENKSVLILPQKPLKEDLLMGLLNQAPHHVFFLMLISLYSIGKASDDYNKIVTRIRKLAIECLKEINKHSQIGTKLAADANSLFQEIISLNDKTIEYISQNIRMRDTLELGKIISKKELIDTLYNIITTQLIKRTVKDKNYLSPILKEYEFSLNHWGRRHINFRADTNTNKNLSFDTTPQYSLLQKALVLRTDIERAGMHSLQKPHVIQAVSNCFNRSSTHYLTTFTNCITDIDLTTTLDPRLATVDLRDALADIKQHHILQAQLKMSHEISATRNRISSQLHLYRLEPNPTFSMLTASIITSLMFIPVMRTVSNRPWLSPILAYGFLFLLPYSAISKVFISSYTRELQHTLTTETENTDMDKLSTLSGLSPQALCPYALLGSYFEEGFALPILLPLITIALTYLTSIIANNKQEQENSIDVIQPKGKTPRHSSFFYRRKISDFYIDPETESDTTRQTQLRTTLS